jgi:hypothetical protein
MDAQTQQLQQQTALAHLAEIHFKDCKRCQAIVNVNLEANAGLSRKIQEIFKKEQMALMPSERAAAV